MKPLRTTGIFLLCCGVICLIIAIERYQSAVLTGKKVAEKMEVEFESVGIPLECTVTGFVAVVFFVAAVRLLWESRRRSKEKSDTMLHASDTL